MVDPGVRLPPDLESVHLQPVLQLLLFISTESDAGAWTEAGIEAANLADCIDAKRHVGAPDSFLVEPTPRPAGVEHRHDPQEVVA